MGHRYLPADIEAALGQRYLVDRQIAVGGQAAVFKATRISRPDGTQSDDTVALKLYFYYSQATRVQREIAAMESISHPNMARLIEHGHCTIAGKYTRYITWEYVEGQTLSQRLKGGRLLESEVLAIARDVSAAIAAIWSQRIVHGDIKPSNIMLRDGGGTVLIDLGAAKYLEQENPAATAPFGTMGYFSPEQARGEKSLSCASDTFSLGVVMLEALMGRHPTNYDQAALAEGIRASGGKLAVSIPLLCTLDKMLSERPGFRPMPNELSGQLQRMLQKIQSEYAQGGAARVPKAVG